MYAVPDRNMVACTHLLTWLRGHWCWSSHYNPVSAPQLSVIMPQVKGCLPQTIWKEVIVGVEGGEAKKTPDWPIWRGIKWLDLPVFFLFFFLLQGKHLPRFSHSWAGSPPGLPQYSPSAAWLSAALWRLSTTSPARSKCSYQTLLCWLHKWMSDWWPIAFCGWLASARLLTVTFVLAVSPQAKH